MDKFNEYLEKYQQDPYNIDVCRLLHMEYIKRGLEGPANEMKAHIERLGYPALEYKEPYNFWNDIPLMLVAITICGTLIWSIYTSNFLFLLCGILSYPYLYPSMLAWDKKIQGKYGVLILNLCFGWVCIPWVIALIWALAAAKNGDKNL